MSNAPKTQAPKKAYSLQQVADMLGTCRQTIYRRVIAEEIPCNRSLGPKLWRIPAEWVESYLSCQNEQPAK